MINVKQQFSIHKVIWVKSFGNKYAYCLTDNDSQNKSGMMLCFDKNHFEKDAEVKLVNTLVPSNKTVSGWLNAHSFLEAM